jgi:hypothetical protein
MKMSMEFWWSYADIGMIYGVVGVESNVSQYHFVQISHRLAYDRTSFSAEETLNIVSLLLCAVLLGFESFQPAPV